MNTTQKQKLIQAWETLQEVCHDKVNSVLCYEYQTAEDGFLDESTHTRLRDSADKYRAAYEAFTRLLEEDGIIPKLG